mgnify:CR=1 FL=1
MSVNEKMVQDIVQEVVAKMQISSDVAGKKGVFSDMNEAIEASKKTQKIVARMSMDQREKIISCIRKKIKENAEIFDFDLSIEDIAFIDSLHGKAGLAKNPDEVDF